jgi:uncharacterized membrane protein
MKPEYSLGKVDEVLEEVRVSADGEFYIQRLRVEDESGELKEVTFGDEFQPLNSLQKKSEGQRVILVSQPDFEGNIRTDIADAYRLPTVLWLFILFSIVVVWVGKKKGLFSIVGLVLTYVILLQFIVPQILSGADPIMVSLFGSLLIGSATMYLSHGYNLKSHIALGSMMLSLTVVAVLSYLSVKGAYLFGMGAEEAYFLQLGETATINLQGLLLGGIMLGALGVLDDVTVSQTSVVFQLRQAKKNINFGELYARGIEVGRDHVASLVNTLVLAYAGANMPLFLLFTIFDEVPTWVSLNSEVVVEEVIRTLTGSIGLVLAVPLTTLVATWFALKLKQKELDDMDHIGHSH